LKLIIQSETNEHRTKTGQTQYFTQRRDKHNTPHKDGTTKIKANKYVKIKLIYYNEKEKTIWRDD
jgi:hypothetical protein